MEDAVAAALAATEVATIIKDIVTVVALLTHVQVAVSAGADPTPITHFACGGIGAVALFAKCTLGDAVTAELSLAAWAAAVVGATVAIVTLFAEVKDRVAAEDSELCLLYTSLSITT